MKALKIFLLGCLGMSTLLVTSCKKEELPTLSTSSITNIDASSAISGGYVTSDGGSQITERGVCWSLSENPTISDSKTNDGNGIGQFVSEIIGLTAGSTYHVRAYASNSVGTAYGADMLFSTVLSDGEGNIYQSITIGTQVWLSENLKTTKYNDETSIPYINDPTAWSALISPGYCWYNNDAVSFKDSYGALYNWYAINTGKLCPIGWHIPSDAEWTLLTTTLGGVVAAGGKLKETGTLHWESPNVEATNATGFTALPGSFRDHDGSFFPNLGRNGYWWSSTESSNTHAISRYLHYSLGEVGIGIDYKLDGFSVRCIKDN